VWGWPWRTNSLSPASSSLFSSAHFSQPQTLTSAFTLVSLSHTHTHSLTHSLTLSLVLHVLRVGMVMCVSIPSSVMAYACLRMFSPSIQQICVVQTGASAGNHRMDSSLLCFPSNQIFGRKISPFVCPHYLLSLSGSCLSAGLIFTLPALYMMGEWPSFPILPTSSIALCGGILGPNSPSPSPSSSSS
jgi:hypothetical protein